MRFPRVCGVRRFELRDEPGVPVDACLLPVRIEMTQHVPRDNDVCQPHVEIGATCSGPNFIDGSANGFDGRGTGIGIAKSYGHSSPEALGKVDVNVSARGRPRVR